MARTATTISWAGCGHGCGCIDITHSILRPETGNVDRSTILPSRAPTRSTGRTRPWRVRRVAELTSRIESAGSQQQRRRGLVLLLEWLSEQPGASWQDRWLASGADAAGARWRQIPAQWLRGRGHDADGQHAVFGAALPVAICAEVVRPGLAWLVSATSCGGALVRLMAQTRDVEGFARLRQACDHDAQTMAARGHTLHRAAVVLAAKGGTIADITVGDVLELLEVQASVHRQPMAHGAAFYRTLHQSGCGSCAVLASAPPSS